MAKFWICEGFAGCWICLNKPKYTLIMSQYGWICLNNTENDWICQHLLEKTECWICQDSECAWCRGSGRGGIGVKLEHFDKHFVKNTRKKFWEFFLLDTLKTIFWMENLAHRLTQLGFFPKKSGHFFCFSKGR